MQKRRALLFFAFALVFGAAAAFLAHRALERQQVEPIARAVETVPVVLARVDLAVGSSLAPEQLRVVAWPKEYAPGGAFREAEQLGGRVLRRALAAGEPLLEPSLLPEGAEGGLVAVIADSARAVSVKVDPIIGVAGFVTPGARVDVLATLRQTGSSQKIPMSKVILQDVRVLAIDQKMETARSGDPELVSVVTLEVSPTEAEQLAYSAHEGRLQLALRSPSDRERIKTLGVAASDLLARPRARAARRVGVQVVKGGDVSVKSF